MDMDGVSGKGGTPPQCHLSGSRLTEIHIFIDNGHIVADAGDSPALHPEAVAVHPAALRAVKFPVCLLIVGEGKALDMHLAVFKPEGNGGKAFEPAGQLPGLLLVYIPPGGLLIGRVQ